MKTKIFALHGFLGEAQDWRQVFAHIHHEKPDWDLYAVDLLQEKHIGGADQSMEKWAQNFNGWVRAQGEGKRTLVGYSMGGRLALHVVENDPELWASAVFLSTHPGLLSNEDRHARVQADQVWADRFAHDDFQQTWQAWNSQAVFTGSTEPARVVKAYQKEELARCLTQWSLGRQKDFRVLLDLWNVRQIWAAGEKDQKFVQLLKTLPETEDLQKWVVEEASHRLLFDAAQEVAHFAVRISSPIPDLHPGD